jgi:eukaryotic-like serine/threonine-protein kinase
MVDHRFPKVPSDDVATAAAEGRLKAGTLIDEKYRIVRRLGSGTVGQVYEATHTLIGHRVALKVLSREMAVRSDGLMLLLHEARVANSIRHPNIVQMTDLAQTRDGLLYLVMELLEGIDLARWMARRGPIARLDSLDVVVQLCAGLSVAHAEGVYHRDLKPQNIFLVRPDDPVPTVKILDFGLSRVATPGTRSLWYTGGSTPVGTPLYIAPELAMLDKSSDHRADVYSLGVILYQMWTGRLPFDSPSIDEVLRMHIEEPPPPPSKYKANISEQSEKILLKALAKDPKDRYQTVDELRMELELVSALPRVPKLKPEPDPEDV